MKNAIAILAAVLSMTACSGIPTKPTNEPALSAAKSAAATSAPLLKNPSFNSGPDGRIDGWDQGGHMVGSAYTFTADSAILRSAPSSVRIERVGTEPFGLLDQQIRMRPEWRGKTLRLSGWLKSQDVSGVGGALIIRADGGSGQILQWNFMDDKRVLGSQDWKLHSIDLKIPPETFFFQVGVMLQGGGKLWADDFALELVE